MTEQTPDPFRPSSERPVIETLPHAELKLRFFNYLIDYVMLVFVAAALVTLTLVLGGEAALLKLQEIPDLLLAVVSIVLYYVTMESMWGQTVGKMITKTYVVDNFGGRACFSQILVRTLSRIIPFEQLSFLLLKRGLHDSLSKTCVIKIDKKRV